MDNQYITNGTISIGIQHFSDIRKKPCICINQRNETTVLGTFRNEECAEFFIDKLARLTGSKEVLE